MSLSGQRFRERLRRRLDARSTADQLRTRRLVTPIDSVHVDYAGRRCVNFASNNYLGLTHHPRMLAVLAEADSAGSGAAALISGYSPAIASAEQRVARWKSSESALLLPSGYQANHAAVQTFAALADDDAGNVRFLVDKLVHASLIDAVRGTGMPMRVFPHNQFDKLRRLLADAPVNQLQVVLTESIFSMDGDSADLAGLAALKREFDFTLLLDEAHGTGVYGSTGEGYAAEIGLAGLADVTICTLSKAVGAIGGAICASQAFCDAVINFGRAYVFSTAVPGVVGQLAETAIAIMGDEPWRQQRVRTVAKTVRSRLGAAGLRIINGDSPIVPVVLGDERTTLTAADRLLAAGILCVAVRPPTVPIGQSRLRITLSCDHSDEELDLLTRTVLAL